MMRVQALLFPLLLFIGHQVFPTLASVVEAKSDPDEVVAAVESSTVEIRDDQELTAAAAAAAAAAATGNDGRRLKHTKAKKSKSTKGPKAMKSSKSPKGGTPNRPPVITPPGQPLTAAANSPFNYTVVASDPDGDTLTYYLAATPPAGMTINSSTGFITWTAGKVGNYSFIAQVTDGNGGSALLDYTIVVSVVGYRSLKESPFDVMPHDTTEKEDILKVISETYGSPDSSFSEKEDMLSPEQCKGLKDYADTNYAIQLPALSDELRADYIKDIPIADLIELLGLDTIKSLITFFYDSTGSKTPIVRSYIRRTYMEGGEVHIPYHTDDRSIMMVAVNGDQDYKGGELVYLNRAGPKRAVRTPGKAIVQGPRDIHGVLPHVGTRYTLLFLGKADNEPVPSGTTLEEALKDYEVADEPVQPK